MKRLAIVTMTGSALLAGCADTRLIQTVCSHQIATTAAAELALRNAYLIKDDAARAAAIAAANATLSLIAGCPGYAGPTPVVPAS